MAKGEIVSLFVAGGRYNIVRLGVRVKLKEEFKRSKMAQV